MALLSSCNQRWHRLLDKQYQEFLESLTALEFERAFDRWLAFRKSLSTHIEFEEIHIEPLTEAWEENTLTLIRADHMILKRLLPRLHQAFEAIAAAPTPRAELVRQLDGFIKLRNVLEHHDLRENEMLYSQLDKALDQSALNNLAGQMDTALEKLR